MNSLVISRYNENIDWIDSLININIVIYDKGEEYRTSKSNVKVISRDNVGREAETYLYHIIENYESLDDVIVFTQAYPFDNIPEFLNYQSDFYTTNKNYFNWYGSKTFECDENGGPTIYPILSGHPNEYQRTLKSIYEDVFNEDCPIKITYKPCASFCVSKDRILRREKSFYEKLISLVNYPEQNFYNGQFKSNAYESHILERLWGLIFNEV